MLYFNQTDKAIFHEILENSSVKLINTASTGLNHINHKRLNKNNVLNKRFQLIKNLPSTSELSFD